MGVESYKHQFAKATLAGWLRELARQQRLQQQAQGKHWADAKIDPIGWAVNRHEPHFGVWLEYPVCLDKNNEIVGLNPVWDESDEETDGNWTAISPSPSPWKDTPPTYQQVLAKDLLPIAIFDVAIQNKGMIVIAFEVVHRNESNQPSSISCGA